MTPHIIDQSISRLLLTLKRARRAIDTPAKWTRDVEARNAAGTPVAANNDDACSFCINGALRRGSGRNPDVARHYLCKATDTVGYLGLAEWQDTPERTHAEVLAAFSLAIKMVH